VTKIPVVASTPFLNIVPSGFGFLGSYVTFGNPPVAKVFGLHEDIHSSINKYTVLNSSLRFILMLLQTGQNYPKEHAPNTTNARDSKAVEIHKQMHESSAVECTAHNMWVA